MVFLQHGKVSEEQQREGKENSNYEGWHFVLGSKELKSLDRGEHICY